MLPKAELSKAVKRHFVYLTGQLNFGTQQPKEVMLAETPIFAGYRHRTGINHMNICFRIES